MKRYELISINEDELENVSLTDEELNSINSKLLKQIEQLSVENSKLNIDTSLPNILDTISNNTSNSSYHSTPNENILRDLVIKAIDKTVGLKRETILFKGFFLAGGGNEFTLVNINPYGFTYYYQTYLTKTELIVYSLGLYFNLIHTNKISLKTIDSASIFDTLPDGKKLGHNYLFLKLNNFNNPNISSYHFVSLTTNDDTHLNNFLLALQEVGIQPFKRKISKTNIYFYLSLIPILIYLIYFFFK